MESAPVDGPSDKPGTQSWLKVLVGLLVTGAICCGSGVLLLRANVVLAKRSHDAIHAGMSVAEVFAAAGDQWVLCNVSPGPGSPLPDKTVYHRIEGGSGFSVEVPPVGLVTRATPQDVTQDLVGYRKLRFLFNSPPPGVFHFIVTLDAAGKVEGVSDVVDSD